MMTIMMMMMMMMWSSCYSAPRAAVHRGGSVSRLLTDWRWCRVFFYRDRYRPAAGLQRRRRRQHYVVAAVASTAWRRRPLVQWRQQQRRRWRLWAKRRRRRRHGVSMTSSMTSARDVTRCQHDAGLLLTAVHWLTASRWHIVTCMNRLPPSDLEQAAAAAGPAAGG